MHTYVQPLSLCRMQPWCSAVRLRVTIAAATMVLGIASATVKQVIQDIII